MSIYLHHYPASLYSEKVRALLGYLGLPWRSVIIPSIMPRPLLMPLTGGYRKTPVLQIGANVYCDSKVIALGLARHSGDQTLYRHGFAAHRVADWADTHLFQVTVALNFSPEAIGAMMGRIPPEEAAAFQKDRAELAQGAVISGFSPPAAAAYLRHHLSELEQSLSGDGYLFGDTPSIADFSLYHCLWFLENNPVNVKWLEPLPAVRAWMARLAAFGHGVVEEVDGSEALAEALATEPVIPAIDSVWPQGFSAGQSVDVAPVDYGRVPVRGTLAAWSPDEIVIERASDETGAVLVHFPSPGFQVTAV